MARTGSGVEVRPNSIRIKFVFQGQEYKPTLMVEGQPMAPTPKNVKAAHALGRQIREAIKHDRFVMADYFPDSPHATTGQGITVADQLDIWLKVQIDLAPSTLKGYKVAVKWWKLKIGGVQVKGLKRSAILTALASEPAWTGKTRNNKVSVLRQAIDLAVDDEIVKTNPVTGLKRSPHQSPPPDPFSVEETEAIIAELFKRYDPQIGNYFGAKFFSGLRTSESLAVRWPSIDWRLSQLMVCEAIVLGEHKDNTKTNIVRTVQLNSRALEYLKAQKAITFMADRNGWVFKDPKTGKRWVDDWTPREMYWRPTLTKLGIRYRNPYQTRHTYATMMLMAGMTPAFCARQLGHSVEMFLRTYSKWIDGGRNEVEMRKLETFIAPAVAGQVQGNG